MHTYIHTHIHTKTHTLSLAHTHAHEHKHTGNDIYDNESSGVVIRSLGNPVLRRNKIHHGRKNGVYVYMNGLGTLEGNEIYDNKMDGISVKSGGLLFFLLRLQDGRSLSEKWRFRDQELGFRQLSVTSGGLFLQHL
jgi:hypothetical protein